VYRAIEELGIPVELVEVVVMGPILLDDEFAPQ
jgi:hypothetical protein